MSDGAAPVIRALSRAARILIIMHATPDGDSAGSGLALGLALRRQGKQVDWVALGGIPDRLGFLPASGDVVNWEQLGRDAYDIAVSVDCGHPTRLAAPPEFWRRGLPLVNIDHHPTNPNFGTINWVEPDASSTGELIVRLFRAAGWAVNAEEALCLYTAISTDTLSFRQVNTTGRTFDAVKWLVDEGRLNLGAANRRIWDSLSEGEVRFLGWALGAVEMSADGRVAWVAVPRMEMERFGVDDSAVDTVVHHLVSIETVTVAFLVREAGLTGRVKVSWRGKPPIDVGTLAQAFGGGGHRFAAAAQLDTTLDEAVGAVRSSLTEVLHGG